MRLYLGFSACLIAAGTFYYDYKFGFEAAKSVTLVGVVAYFLLNTALTWWIWWIEDGVVYVGEKDGIKVRFGSKFLPRTSVVGVRIYLWRAGMSRSYYRQLWRNISRSIS